MSIIKVGGKEINLDESLLSFDEHTINQFLQNFASMYNVYQQAYADAQYLNSKFEDHYDVVYSTKFKEARENCSSDKMADMTAKTNPEVIEAQANMRSAKKNMTAIYLFIKTMDRAFDGASNYGHNLRKELSSVYGAR